MQAFGDNILHNSVNFEDYFPSMMTHMGNEGFICELCNGFRLLMDAEKGLITFESLKKSCVLLGITDLHDDELVCMLLEGDVDGDGALNQTEFCMLMFKLSPGMMKINDNHNEASNVQWNSNVEDLTVMNVLDGAGMKNS